MVNIRVDENDLLDMLIDRLDFWHIDGETRKLYEDMYESLVWDGCFDGMNFDVKQIVDNDYVNNCSVIDETDECYNEIKTAWENHERGTDNCTIESANDDGTLFLVRW